MEVKSVMDYDVLILGGGIVGCAVAYELSKYSLNIALIEKDYDVADDVALINTSIVYNGVECLDSLTSQLECIGNNMLDEVATKFKVPFKRMDCIYLSQNENEKNILDTYLQNDMIKQCKVLSNEEQMMIKNELNISNNKAFKTNKMGVICPYDLALAYAEVAFDNGVNFKFGEEVLKIQKKSKGFKVETNKNKFTCHMVVNTIPKEIYNISGKKSNRKISNLYYMNFDKILNLQLDKIVFKPYDKDCKVYITPTMDGKIIAAVRSTEELTIEEVIGKVKELIGNIRDDNIINYYHWKFYNDDIIIDDSYVDTGYIKVSGRHNSQVTLTPAISKIVCETIVSNLFPIPKKDFIDKRREVYRFKKMTNEERNEIIKADKKYGKIICSCEMITEGEIVDSIRRPLGARTLEGVKRRTGVTGGGCIGSYCLNKVAAILARETNKGLEDIVKDSKNSNIVKGRIKEFEDI